MCAQLGTLDLVPLPRGHPGSHRGALPRRDTRERSTDLVIPAVLAALGVVVWASLAAAYWPFTVDDTFISLRYAEHIAEGIGPTWNAGAPHAEGYTSPLWIALLALALALGIPGELAAKTLGVGAMALALVLAARLAWALGSHAGAARRDRALASGVAVLVLAALPATAIHAVSGMETGLATALVAGYALALVAMIDRPGDARLALAAALGLAASLARPELNLFVALATLGALARLDRAVRRRFALAVLALHVLPGALYFGWRLAYYGRWLPLPFYVKAVLPSGTFAGAGEALGFARMFAIERLDVAIACALGLVHARRAVLPIAAALAGVWLFFFVPAHEMGFDFRYLHPLLPVIAGAAGAGAARLRRWLGSAGVPLIAAAVAIAPIAHASPHLEGSLEEKRAYGAGVRRAHERIGRALGEIRGELARPTLAALDCGAISYFSRWTVIDTWGLNEPAVADTGRRDAARVLDQQPSVVIVVSSRPDRFAPHFDYEQALWDLARARGMTLAARFEFLPDYHLFALAIPGSREAEALGGATEHAAR